MMKKYLRWLIVMVVMSLLFSCTNSKLSDKFDEQQVLDKAKAVVDVINTRQYVDVISLLREDLQTQITADQLEIAWDDQINAAGEFDKIKNYAMESKEDSVTKEEYVTVVLEGIYAEDTLIYTLSFDENLDMIGLYMK